jgi:hypothetical protein
MADYRAIILVRTQRLATCDLCEYKTDSVIGPMCSKCKCILAGKASLPLAKCPMGKWEK